MSTSAFEDRSHAGRQLAEILCPLGSSSDEPLVRTGLWTRSELPETYPSAL